MSVSVLIGIVLMFIYASLRPPFFRGEVLTRSTPTLVPEDIGAEVGLFGVDPDEVRHPTAQTLEERMAGLDGVPHHGQQDPAGRTSSPTTEADRSDRRGAEGGEGRRVPGGHHPGRRARADRGRPHRLRRAGGRGGLVDPRRASSWPPGPRSWTTRTTSGPASDMVLGVKEPIAEEYPRLGARTGPGPLHLPPPGRLPAVHRRPRGRRQHGHRLRDGAPGRQLPSTAHPDERGGRADGPADGRPPPHAPGRRSRHPGVRRARRALRQDRDPRRRRGRHGRGHPRRGHARRGLHPGPQPRTPAPGRPPFPGCPGDRRLHPPTPSRRSASTPTS